VIGNVRGNELCGSQYFLLSWSHSACLASWSPTEKSSQDTRYRRHGALGTTSADKSKLLEMAARPAQEGAAPHMAQSTAPFSVDRACARRGVQDEVCWPGGPRWSGGSYCGGEFAPGMSARSSRDLGQKSTAELQRSLGMLAGSSLGCTEAILLASRAFAPLGAGRSGSDPFSVNESNRVADHACRRVNHRALFDGSLPPLPR
jgi:hypothetical protein